MGAFLGHLLSRPEGRYGLVDKTHPSCILMHQTRIQYPGATLGGQAGHYPTPAVKGISWARVWSVKTLSLLSRPTGPLYTLPIKSQFSSEGQHFHRISSIRPYFANHEVKSEIAVIGDEVLVPFYFYTFSNNSIFQDFFLESYSVLSSFSKSYV